MRHRIKKTILGRKAAPRKAMLSQLAASVILYEKVKTTEAKAKAVKPFVERLITKSKAGDLTARRALIKDLQEKLAVQKLLEVTGPKYKDRKGGYTRIVKLGVRRGDAAKMVQIELV